MLSYWLIDWFVYLFYSIPILVYNKDSLYNEIWVKQSHLHAKSSSLQGWPLDKFGRGKIIIKKNCVGDPRQGFQAVSEAGEGEEEMLKLQEKN